MKESVIKITLFLTVVAIMVSCSHQNSQVPPERSVASKQCWDSVKGEYHSYFDQVEKCIEKDQEK
jgi:hypothetical protein